uniref:Uncharacterized protein n=1 Tax=Anguilla anguilla TaxID=7936 RepID=A0A0E9RM98_ANGAN
MEIFFLIITRSAYGFSVVFIIWFIQPALSDMRSSLRAALSKKGYQSLSLKAPRCAYFHS